MERNSIQEHMAGQMRIPECPEDPACSFGSYVWLLAPFSPGASHHLPCTWWIHVENSELYLLTCSFLLWLLCIVSLLVFQQTLAGALKLSQNHPI
jgi:hypothetical protein